MVYCHIFSEFYSLYFSPEICAWLWDLKFFEIFVLFLFFTDLACTNITNLKSIVIVPDFISRLLICSEGEIYNQKVFCCLPLSFWYIQSEWNFFAKTAFNQKSESLLTCHGRAPNNSSIFLNCLKFCFPLLHIQLDFSMSLWKPWNKVRFGCSMRCLWKISWRMTMTEINSLEIDPY